MLAKIAFMSIQGVSLYNPSLSNWKYDVFLSFKGEDTRKNFTDHLHAALIQKGINVFKDEKELVKGKSISCELYKAIEESRISIIVFSRNYASSIRCLDELVKIIQCMKIKKQMVIPIFYDVDPFVVRKQIENYQESFSKHEELFRENIKKVQNWRNALNEAANLCGWHLKDGYESKFVQDIVNEISRKLCATILRHLEDLVGIDSRLETLRKVVMGTNYDDIRMIGIHGMGGIGKTTITRAVYDLISCEFEGNSFLANVREVSRKNGLVHLQKQLLSQILREKYIHIWDVYDGIRMIRSRLCRKKVLVVIDDVNDIKQLNELIGKHEWFGLGSRIIITTRDRHLLIAHGVDKIYQVEELDTDEAFQLFSLKAFKNYYPPKEYEELSKCVVKYACGLPLALQVLGSFLYGRTIDEWESALERLGRDCEKEILDRLQISFDGLQEIEKKIFLDIACFFKGEKVDRVARILEGCGFSPVIGISILVDRSLITISDKNILWMHDLLQQMGQQIVKRESKEPGKCSRLWDETDIHHVLTRNTGTEVVEGIILKNEFQYLSVTAEAFSKMTELRLLKISNVQLFDGLDHLSNNLSLLEWHGYPLKFLPPSLQLQKTVELKMHYSRIKQLWKETKPLNKLKVISLIHSKNLNKTPDFTMVPNLEELILEGCIKLCEIHPSLLVHRKLILLNLRDCIGLTTLPRKMDMKCLKVLVLSGCLKLNKFPDSVQSVECLSELFLDGTPIKELPFPVELMKRIVLMSMKNCKNLVSLPSNVNCLQSLKTLKLSGCSKLENVPENLGQVEGLEKLNLSGTAIRQLVSSIFVMKNLKKLSFRGCKGIPSTSWSWYTRFPFSLMSRRYLYRMALRLPSLSGLCSLIKLDLRDCNLGEGAIVNEIGYLVSLKILYLNKNNFVSLPPSINNLSKLEYLCLNECKKLQSLPELPLSLMAVGLDDCTSLERFPTALKSCRGPLYINCVNCLKLPSYNSAAFTLIKEIISNRRTQGLTEIIFPGSEVPKWFSQQSESSPMRIKRCTELQLHGIFVCSIISSHKHLPTCNTYCYRLSYADEEIAFSIGAFFRDNGNLSDHLWLIYIPVQWIHHWQHENCSFRFHMCHDIIGRRCAAHPIYEEEMDEFNLSTEEKSDFVSRNLVKFQQDFVETSERDVPPQSQHPDAADTSVTGKEPQTKRQKTL